MTANYKADRMYKPIIVLDDDPTGTQTVHNVPVITEWTTEAIEREFKKRTPLFYVLTNSRALVATEADSLGQEIGRNIAQTDQACWLISRSDSTLRGHFPNEVEALANGLGWGDDYLTVLIPAFFEGNRLTKEDVHYLVENGKWIPVGETPYARDQTFGYKSSNLKKWVEEKSKGKIKAEEVASISIENLENDPDELIMNLVESANKILIVNALNSAHLCRFASIVKRTLRPIIFRTGASWVAALGNVSPKLLSQKGERKTDRAAYGGLIVVGSHVPKTTAQLNELLKTDITPFEFRVEEYLANEEKYLSHFSATLNDYLAQCRDAVVYTSRILKTGQTEEESLKVSVKVSEGLIAVVRHLNVPPRFFIAKGGITSSDLATKGLGVKRAMVLGQIAAGVPIWQLGEEAKFPNMAYVVFPGNVGQSDTLRKVYEAF